MRNKILLLAVFLLAAFSSYAQVSCGMDSQGHLICNVPITYVFTDPVGACTYNHVTVNRSTGVISGCVSGSWASIGSSGSASTVTPVDISPASDPNQAHTSGTLGKFVKGADRTIWIYDGVIWQKFQLSPSTGPFVMSILTGSVTTGTLAGRPATPADGTLYCATDDSGQLRQYSGILGWSNPKNSAGFVAEVVDSTTFLPVWYPPNSCTPTPSAGGVPYTGATGNLDIGTYSFRAAGLSSGKIWISAVTAPANTVGPFGDTKDGVLYLDSADSHFKIRLANGVVTDFSAGGTQQAATPTFSPVAGTYSSSQSVTPSSTTSGATICYTVDGSTPAASTPGTCSAGTTYSTPISVTTTETIKAIATKTGYSNSPVASAVYTINTVPAVFTGITNYWKMDEASNVTRLDSAGTTNLSDVNSSVPSATGIINNGTAFGGVGTQILAPASPISIASGTAWSMSMWLNCSTFGSIQGIFGNLFTASNYTRLYIGSNTSITLSDDNNSNPSATVPAMSTSAWHHLVVVVKADKSATAYLDNVSYAMASIGTYSANFTIKQFGNIGGTSAPTSCKLDEVGLWVGTALTAGNVSTLYNGGAGLAY